jgi:hypothetical protein
MRTLIRTLIAASLLLGTAAASAQAPPIIPLQGYVTDSEGAALSGPASVDVSFHDAAVDGETLFEESLVVVVVDGFFSAEVGLTEVLDLALFRDNSEVWVEVAIDGDVLEPRLAFGTVPYAAWADHAGDAATVGGMTAEELSATEWSGIEGVPDDLLDGDDVLSAGDGLVEADGVVAVDRTSIQTRLSTDCPAGSSIRAIGEDGSVTCHEDVDTDTTYSAGLGLSVLDGIFAVDLAAVQARVATACPEGSSIRAIGADGAVVCHVDVDTDTDTTYSAGTGLSLLDTVFSIDTAAVQARVTGTCGEGSAIREVLEDGAVVCQPVGEGGTVYAAGPGITITEGQISVTEEGIGAPQILDGSVGPDELQDHSIDEDEIDLQGIRVVRSETPLNIWSRLLVTSRTPFTHFRIMLSVNGLTGGGSTTPGGPGTVTFDLAQDCQTEFGGDQTISVSGTPSGGYPLVYVSDEFPVGAVACFVAVKVNPTGTNPVVVREVELIPTAWAP